MGGVLGLETVENMASTHEVYFDIFTYWLIGPACDSLRASQLRCGHVVSEVGSRCVQFLYLTVACSLELVCGPTACTLQLQRVPPPALPPRPGHQLPRGSSTPTDPTRAGSPCCAAGLRFVLMQPR